MRVVCEECKKVYDYEKDDFCPRCGAYNPPKKNWTVNAQGDVVRTDGLNEANHAGSFAHREVHREKATRRALGLDRPKTKPQKKAPPTGARQRSGQSAQGFSLKSLLAVLIWIFVILQLVRFFTF